MAFRATVLRGDANAGIVTAIQAAAGNVVMMKAEMRAGHGGGPDGRPVERIHGSIAHQLGIAIISGKYLPGHVLNDEISASEQLGVSRTAYREAIRILGAKGMVSSRPKVGTTINARSRWNHLDPDVLAWSFETTPDENFINDLFELRAVIEPAAAAFAAERRDQGQLARMQLALQIMERATLATPEGHAADRDFHEVLLEATRNEAMSSLASGISAAVLWTTIFKQQVRMLPRDPVPDHIRVYEAIRDQKPAAARRAMADLIRLGLQDTRLSMQP
jgi:DNA-binding FadR family transcriptional regulator